MPNSRLLWRALAAWLGALLLIGSMWPIICAARPFPPYNHFALNWNRPSVVANASAIDVSGSSNVGTNSRVEIRASPPPRPPPPTILVNNSDITKRASVRSASNQPVALSARVIHPIPSNLNKSPHNANESKTIESIFKRNRTRTNSSKLSYHNRNVSDRRNRLFASVHISSTTMMSSTVAAASSRSHADADKFATTRATPERAELNLDSMNLAVENLASGRRTTASAVTEPPSIRPATELSNSNSEDDALYDNVTTLAPPDIFNEQTTERKTLQSVFLDFSGVREDVTFPIHTLFNSTKAILNASKMHAKRHETASTTQPAPLPSTSRATTTTTPLPFTPTTGASQQHHQRRRQRLRNDPNLDRNERSANLSLTRTSNRIQLLVKGRLLQILPNGVVNGTDDDQSEHSEY